MSSILHRLSPTVLDELARALSAGRIAPPYSAFALREWTGERDQSAVCAEFERFRAAGMTSPQVGILMGLLATERAQQQADQERIQMVWTGPDQEGPWRRDTSVVARELLGHAKQSLLIATYSISRGSTTFEPVRESMCRNPDLDVTLVLHVSGPSIDLAVREFAKDFWSVKWPWPQRPKVYFDPRGIGPDPMDRALQHAKCIVADGERVLITSANYTESGHLRNIELDVVIRDRLLAQRVEGQFASLIARKLLVDLV